MELKRKKKRTVVHGDYCVLNTDNLKKGIIGTRPSLYHQKHPILNVFEIEKFIVSKSIFGGKMVAIMPVMLNNHDYWANRLLKFLKTTKYYYVDTRYLDPVSFTISELSSSYRQTQWEKMKQILVDSNINV
jgi:hypothetical protein|tara:strand:+ start:151 stop:543 length:393 start_codon:yes stop_codon:yes gene_type:complete